MEQAGSGTGMAVSKCAGLFWSPNVAHGGPIHQRSNGNFLPAIPLSQPGSAGGMQLQHPDQNEQCFSSDTFLLLMCLSEAYVVGVTGVFLAEVGTPNTTFARNICIAAHKSLPNNTKADSVFFFAVFARSVSA